MKVGTQRKEGISLMDKLAGWTVRVIDVHVMHA